MKVVFDMQKIGDNINNIRIANKISIKEFSIRTKISVSSLYRYKKGASVPNLKSIIKICNCLNVPIDHIISYYLI